MFEPAFCFLKVRHGQTRHFRKKSMFFGLYVAENYRIASPTPLNNSTSYFIFSGLNDFGPPLIFGYLEKNEIL